MKKLSIVLLAVAILAGCSSGKEITLNLAFGERTGTYTGDMIDGIPNGEGKFTSKNENGQEWTYEGTFKNGHFEGEGMTTWGKDQKEIGTYKDDVIVPMEGNELEALFGNTDSYIDHYVKIKANVFTTPDKAEGEWFVQAYPILDNEIDRNDLLWLSVSDEDFSIKADDYIEFTGKVIESGEGTSALGAALSAPVILVENYDVLNYADAISPASLTIEPNKTLDMQGLEITVDKVEFSDKETRVYLTAKNNTSDNWNLWIYSSNIIQNGSQFGTEMNYEADYQEIPTELLPGVTASGVICFKPVEKTDFSLILETNSHDYNIEEQVFNFDIECN